MKEDGAMADNNGDSSVQPGRWVWFVTGPTACGKTTMAKYVAQNLGVRYLEGDDFHPKENIEKMSRGEPLTDSDRWSWLQALSDTARSGTPPSAGAEETSPDLIMTCSALKKEYRDFLRRNSRPDDRSDGAVVRVGFLFLDAPEPVLARRAAERKGHYAGSDLVHSQFRDLEPPDEGDEEENDVLRVDVTPPAEEVRQDVCTRIRRIIEGS